MLYIWPYMAFFSAPLLYPYLLNSIISKKHLPDFISQYIATDAWLHPARVWVLAFRIIAGLLIVHFNTIVHPFTLADNRHYVFYVFRILLRHPPVKYVAVPAYVLCGWAVLKALSAGALATLPTPPSDSRGKSVTTTAPTPRQPISKPSAPPVSFVLVWLLTSTLCLVTAPLVEPRYFIIPWLLWRIHVPIPTREPGSRMGPHALLGPDHRLWLETAWLCAINAITAYLFLYRGFAWPQEPGKIQRFMW